MTKYNPGLHKVKVNTWSTKDKTSNGLDNFLEQEFFGGNVGHASIEMTLPISEKTKKMIETYCMEQTFKQYRATLKSKKRNQLTFKHYMEDAKQRIPVRLVETSTNLARYNVDGVLEKTDETASETSYYKIDFSFWPGLRDPFNLSNIEEDMMSEREGHHFEYSNKAKEDFQPEERIHRGILGSQTMTYAPMAIAHQRDMNDKKFAKIGRALELQKLTELLKAENLLISKVNELKSQKISGTLGLICKNMGLQTKPLVEEYMKENPTKPGGKVDMDKFKEFLIKKAEEYVESLKERKNEISKQIQNIDYYLDKEEYVTRGRPPDHTEELPYLTESGRGLDPEAMLKQIRVLTDPDADAFNLHTKNCSKTCTSVLKAGAKNDPLLEHEIGKEALGFFGTPQQVIGNVLRAQEVINKDQQNTLFTRMGNSDMLNQAMGGFIADYMKADLTTGQKAKAIAGIVGIGILKAPEALFRGLINPSQSIADIASGVGTVFKHSNLLPLKIVTGILSIILMAILVPFALIQKGIGAIAALFQALSNWINKKPPSPELDGQITSPLAYQNKKDVPKNASYRSLISRLVNAEVAMNIREQTIETSTKKSTAMDILTQFESDLEKNPGKVVTLSRNDFDKLNKYVLEKDDSTLSARFQGCCNESLSRARHISPRTLFEVNAIFKKVTSKLVVPPK